MHYLDADDPDKQPVESDALGMLLWALGLLVFGLAIGSYGFYHGQKAGRHWTQQQAINHGYGQFVVDQKTGESYFQWNETPEKQDQR